MEAIFRVWGDKAEPAIAMCQRVQKSAVAFSNLIYGLRWNVRGLENFAQMALTSGQTNIPWLKYTDAIQFYAAAYLERVGQQDRNIFPPQARFFWDLLQFFYRVSNSPDKEKEFATGTPARAREVAKVLYAQERYAALKCWCIGALQAGVEDGLIWKLLGESCKYTMVPGQTKEMVEQLVVACETNAERMGYAKADLDTLEAIRNQKYGKGEESESRVDIDDEDEDNNDFDEDLDTDEDEDDREEEDEEDSDNDEDEDDNEEEEEENKDKDEEESEGGDSRREKGPAKYMAGKGHRGEPEQSVTHLFPQLSGTDILVEFFLGEGLKLTGSRRNNILPHQELLPWVVQQLDDAPKAEFLQKYLSRLLALLKESKVPVAPLLGGAFRVVTKLAELLKVPEVLGLYAVVLDKYFVGIKGTGYLARRIVRTWKAWGKENPDAFVRALAPFLAFYPPLEPMFVKDKARFKVIPFELVKVTPPPPELMANVKDLLGKVKSIPDEIPDDDPSRQEQLEILRQALNCGDTVEALLLIAKATPSDVEAEMFLQKAISLDPNNIQLWLVAADRVWNKFKYLIGALEREPDNPAIYFAFGMALKKRSRYREGMRKRAVTYFKKAIELAPMNSEYLTELGEMLQKDEQFAEAEEALKHALLLNPNDLKAWSLLSLRYVDEKRFPEAQYCIEKVQHALPQPSEDIPKISFENWPKQKVQPRDPLQGMAKDDKLKVGVPELPGNYILVRFLLGNSKRLENRYKRIRLGCTSILAEEAWRTREEIFPEVWEDHPEALWTILLHAQNIVIRDFCLRVLSQSSKGQKFLTQQELGQLIIALRTQHLHTQEIFLPLVIKRLQDLPEVSQETFELLVRLDSVKAWDLVVDLLTANKIKWTPRNLAMVLTKPTVRVRELCQKNAQQVRAIQDDVAREFLKLVAEGDVPLEAITFLLFEFKLNVPNGSLTPLFQSKSEKNQKLLLELLSKWDPTGRVLSAQELAAGLQHPVKEV
ncbi:MAG: hypothetical protein RBG13Loki_0397, partial [Promethearchaeota archaeon CR_4]